MNLANGCYGTKIYDKKTIIKMRRQEGINAAKFLGATYHESLVDDMHIVYEHSTIYKLAAIVR